MDLRTMKNDSLLTTTSLLAIVLTMCHFAQDIVFGYEPGGFNNVTGIVILFVWTVGAVLLVGRWPGYVILLLGSLLAALIPSLHFSGKGLTRIVDADGGYFYIWTLFALGVTGSLALVLTLRGFWNLRRRT